MSSNSLIIKLKVLSELQDYWDLNDPIIPEGYAAYADGSASGQIKIGDGRKKYSELEFTNFTGGSGSTAATIGLATNDEYSIGVSTIVAPSVKQVKIDINNILGKIFEIDEQLNTLEAPTIPNASTDVLGLIRIGDNLIITDQGILSAVVPENVSDLTNDANYATIDSVDTKQDILTAGTNINITDNTVNCTSVATTSAYNDGTSTSLSPSVAQVKGDLSTITTSVLNLTAKVDILQNKVVPENVSELTNDAGYITISSVPVNVSELTNDLDFVTLEILDNRLSTVYKAKGSVPTFDDLPTDPSTGDVYNVSDTGENFVWIGSWDRLSGMVDLSNYVTTLALTAYLNAKQNVLTTGTDIDITNNVISYTGIRLVIATDEEFSTGTSETIVPNVKQIKDRIIAVESKIPTNVSELTNDVGYITISSVPTRVGQLTNDLGYATSNSIPTTTSQLTNDSDFITSEDIIGKQNNLEAGDNISINENVVSFTGIATDEEFSTGTATDKVPSVAQVKKLEERIAELEKLLTISALTDE